MISGGELARRAGVSRQAVSNLTRDGVLPRVADVEGKLGYDETSQAIIDYIEREGPQRLTARKPVITPSASKSQKPRKRAPASEPPPSQTPPPRAPRPPVAPPADTEDLDGEEDDEDAGLEFLGKNDLDRHKTREQIIKARIQNRVERGKYLPREDVRRAFGRVYSVHTSILRPLGAKLGPDLAALFGVTDDALVLKAIQILDAENYRALGMIKRQLMGYLDATGAGDLPDPDHQPELVATT